MPTAEKNIVVVTPEQYTAWVAPPPPLRTQAQFFEHQVDAFVSTTFWEERLFVDIEKLVPQQGPFLLVPPQTHGLKEVMSKVMLNGKQGFSYPDSMRDVIEVPKSPYLMTGVEDGRTRLNVRPSQSEVNILRENRSPYTGWEGVIHVLLFPEVLTHHYLDLLGSRGHLGCFVSLGVGGEVPFLHDGRDGDAYEGYGAPSCEERIGLQ